MRVEVRLDSFVLRVRVLLAEGEEHRIHKERLGLYLYPHLPPLALPRHLTWLRSWERPVYNTSQANGVSKVEIDENNVLSIKGIGVVISTFETRPSPVSPQGARQVVQVLLSLPCPSSPTSPPGWPQGTWAAWSSGPQWPGRWRWRGPPG